MIMLYIITEKHHQDSEKASKANKKWTRRVLNLIQINENFKIEYAKESNKIKL